MLLLWRSSFLRRYVLHEWGPVPRLLFTYYSDYMRYGKEGFTFVLAKHFWIIHDADFLPSHFSICFKNYHLLRSMDDHDVCNKYLILLPLLAKYQVVLGCIAKRKRGQPIKWWWVNRRDFSFSYIIVPQNLILSRQLAKCLWSIAGSQREALHLAWYDLLKLLESVETRWLT